MLRLSFCLSFSSLLFSSLLCFSQNDSTLYLQFYDAMLHNEIEKSESILNQISTDEQRHFFFLIKKAELKFIMGDIDSSVYFYEKVSQFSKNHLNVLDNSTFLKESKQELCLKAINVYNVIINKYPNNPIHYCNRGLYKMEISEFETALEDFRISNQLEPHYLTFYNQAMCKSEMGDLKSAIEDYSSSIMLNAEYGSAYLNRGYCFLELKDYSKAIKDFEKSIAYPQSSIERSYSINNIGLCYLYIGNLKESRSHINLSISLNPINSYAYRNLALLEIESNNLLEACKAIKKSIDLGFTVNYGSEMIELKNKTCN